MDVADRCDRLDEINSSTISEYDQKYPIHDPDFVGYCLIINNKTFTERYLNERWGTEKDVKSLQECWSAFGFRPIVFHDLKHDEIVPKIKEYADKVEPRHSAFAVCISTHGIRDAVYGSDGVPIKAHVIRDAINNRTRLVDKPKILIVQGCRVGSGIEPEPTPVTEFDDSYVHSGGSSLKQDGKSVDCVPDRADTLIFWSTVENGVSYRNKDTGTLFIQDLCKVMMQRADRDHLQDVFIAVTEELSEKNLQICQFESTFRKKLQLMKRH